jgi:hypothetical protein
MDENMLGSMGVSDNVAPVPTGPFAATIANPERWPIWRLSDSAVTDEILRAADRSFSYTGVPQKILDRESKVVTIVGCTHPVRIGHRNAPEQQCAECGAMVPTVVPAGA